MRGVLIHALVFAAALSAAERRGTVKSAGLPIPGATVTALQGARKLTVWTDESVAHRFENLGDGTWKIQDGIAGFEPPARMTGGDRSQPPHASG